MAALAIGPMFGLLGGGSVSAAPTGLYKGSADSGLVALNAVDTGPSSVAEAFVAPSRAEVASDASLAGKQSSATATNLKSSVLGTALPNLVVTATQTAPPDNPAPTVNQLLQLPANPVLEATLTRATAHARPTAAEDCLPDNQPISRATTDVADANVLPGALGLAINNSRGATVNSHSQVNLVGYPNPKRALQATSAAQLTSITLFKGMPNETNINVVATPTLRVLATGVAGTSKVEYTQPILTITGATLPGQIVMGEGLAQTVTIGPLKLSIAPLTKSISADGTKVTASTALLIVNVTLSPTTVLDLQIAPLAASAQVPLGGVNCPDDRDPLRETQKDVSSTSIVPGGQATYTITVPNRGAAPITNIKVVDTVTAPAGTEIVRTEPPATKVEGLVATWEGLGPLEPNQILTLTITIKAPLDMVAGAKFSNKVDVTGTYRGQPTTGTATIEGPTGRNPPTVVACDLTASNLSTSHTRVRQGQTFQHYVHVVNSGQTTCEDVIATLTHDPNEEFVSCTHSCTYNLPTRTITWNLGSIGAGESKTVSAVTRVSMNAPIGDELQGTGTVRSPGTKTVKLIEPITLVTGDSVLRPANPGGFNDETSRSNRAGGTLPATGIETTALALPATALGLAALLLRRRMVRR